MTVTSSPATTGGETKNNEKQGRALFYASFFWYYVLTVAILVYFEKFVGLTEPAYRLVVGEDDAFVRGTCSSHATLDM